LVNGEVSQAAFDPYLEILWYVQADKLYALGLREEEPAPVVVVEKLGPFPVGIQVGARRVEAASPNVISHAMVWVVWGKAPKIVVENTYEGQHPEEAKRAKAQVKAAKAAKLAGAKWLKRQAARAARGAPPKARQPMWPKRVKLPEGTCTCEEDPAWDCDQEITACGQASEFPGAPWQLVVVAFDARPLMGGGVERIDQCSIHDPKTGGYASPDDTSKWLRADDEDARGRCDGLDFDAGLSHWIVPAENLLCARGAACDRLEAILLGWLDPGPSL
jgi:hypothetical protein